MHVHRFANLFAHAGSEEQAAHLINLELVEANAVDGELAEDLDDGSHGEDTVPLNKQQAATGTNDELILLTVNRNTEHNNLLSKELEHRQLVVIVQIHLEDLTAKNVTPVHDVGLLAEEHILAEKIHHGFGHLFNLVVRHVVIRC